MNITDKTSACLPYLSTEVKTKDMMIWTLSGLAILASIYSIFIDHSFLLRFVVCLLIGIGIEMVYSLLRDGSLSLPKASTAVTSALLVLSVPAQMSILTIFYGLIAAIIFAKISIGEKTIRLNPMLLGRLFLMLAFNAEIVSWTREGMDIDAVTTATPLELFHAEEEIYKLSMLIKGNISGSWEGFYEMVPGSPGEIFPVVIIVLGLILYARGILDWRVGVSFLTFFAATCFFINEPVLFNVLSGAAIFSAVFIAGDPRTTPGTRSGRFLAGAIAGVANALIRRYTFYSEGIVFSFLLANLLSPSLDRMAFKARGRMLVYKKIKQEKRLPKL